MRGLRSFRETVNELQVCEFEDFPFQPRTAMEYVKAVSSISESATAQHHMWLGASRIPDADQSVYEDEVLARALDLAVTYDSLNVANLACTELICRRRQLISEAHANSPGAPSYMGAEHLMGQTYRQGGGIVVPTLTDFVAKKMQAQSQGEGGSWQKCVSASTGGCGAVAMPLHSKTNWSSPVFHEPLKDGRKRDVFPLPLIQSEVGPRGDVCRAVAKRVFRRRAVIEEVSVARTLATTGWCLRWILFRLLRRRPSRVSSLP